MTEAARPVEAQYTASRRRLALVGVVWLMSGCVLVGCGGSPAEPAATTPARLVPDGDQPNSTALGGVEPAVGRVVERIGSVVRGGSGAVAGNPGRRPSSVGENAEDTRRQGRGGVLHLRRQR